VALSAKQKAFINEYLSDFNATRAAERAGYKGDANTLAVTGHDLLRNPKISEVISKRLSEAAMTADEVLNRLADQARSSMSDFVRFNDNGDPVFDLQAASVMGKLHLAKKLKTKTRSWSEPTFNMHSGESESREVTETSIEFELYDAQAALVQIGKHHKLFTDKVEVEHSGSVEITGDERAQAAKELEEWNEQKKAGGTSNG
jgi:phage terminase small subunit